MTKHRIKILDKKVAENDYPETLYNILFEKEPGNFWFKSRNKIIGKTFLKYVPLPKFQRVLEIGCGTGFVLAYLEKLGYRIDGVDTSLTCLSLAASRSTTAMLYCMDVHTHALAKKYNAIALFDVIEHIGDDKAFLQSCLKFLEPAGYIVITVPAHAHLWSDFDRLSGHKRRYAKKQLVNLLTSVHCQVIHVQYINFFLYFPQLIAKKLITTRRGSDKTDEEAFTSMFNVHPLMNKLLEFVFTVEIALSEYLSYPTGASLIVVAKKK
jgi:2-polyprenyl-3-methyl-5-hydroxy-6-metoxy-1,4-benzoquinol methylase